MNEKLMETKYIVTSKPGMTPFATTTSAKAARAESRKAKRLGLDGAVIPPLPDRRDHTYAGVMARQRQLDREAGVFID